MPPEVALKHVLIIGRKLDPVSSALELVGCQPDKRNARSTYAVRREIPTHKGPTSATEPPSEQRAIQ
ncbi:hypothetical protein AA0119_g7856 [Alternaria tenuissima]|uniref:Uncharacterized protein n=1 Tax=Alternaria tenuissima TaxID=119927 RepID=A0ABY0G464_9PLEO|nr:hypothetical protein AA0119_g7856 [Alternaria tenuissima]RYO12905.1 hypothetical protein AA0121_g8893 [Alternaria tenuissima]